MKKLILVSCLALAGFSMSASAAEMTGGFIRGEFGNSDVDVSGGGDDEDSAMGIGAGWYFNKNFAVEGFWNNLFDDNNAELSGFGLGLKGKTTVADGKGFYADGRIGMFRAKGELGSFDDTSTNLYFGAGVGYDFSENFGLGLNYTRYNSDFDGGLDIDTSTITGSLEIRF